MMKSIDIPYIEGLGSMDMGRLDLSLDSKGAKGFTDCVCWPERFPYMPDCSFAMGHDGENLCILFHVRGLDLRAQALEDNGPVWEDSCCEVFIADPRNRNYYNFEENCIGTMVNGMGEARNGRVRRGAEEMGRIRRFSTLPRRQIDLSGKIFGWSVGMVIPFFLFGLGKGELPATLRGNVYKCGDKTAHPHFLAWNKVETPAPDFHRPDFFGEFRFIQK